jgi:hypothetical protein
MTIGTRRTAESRELQKLPVDGYVESVKHVRVRVNRGTRGASIRHGTDVECSDGQ